MTVLAKPSRSYVTAEHVPDELLGTAYTASTSTTKKLSKKIEGGFKTYRPPLAETHLRRPLGYDPHPESHFAPLPPAFHLSGKHKKDAALAGQRAELEHILQPEYKSYNYDLEGDSSSIAGPSKNHSSRTAGGLSGLEKKSKSSGGGGGNGLRSSASISSFHQQPTSGGGRRSGGGIYVDSNGKLHDNEFDPFGHVSEMSRAKSRRRSAFGSDRRKGDSSSSESGSDISDNNLPRRSTDTGREREEEEIRKRLEMERKRLDDVSGYAAARRRSMMIDGRTTPSIRSSEDGNGFIPSMYSASLAPAMTSKSKSQGHYVRSPLSPTFDHSPVHSTPPEKTTESTKHKETKSRVEVSKDGSKKITGFDAPISPVPLHTPSMGNDHLLPPPLSVISSGSGRLSPGTRGSIDTGRERPPKPTERPREELFPETPAQIKRREEREKRSRLRPSGLAVDTVIAGSGKARILPEIEIVEDDDPRIVFPSEGKTTRVQSTHDHVIRGPFSHALNALGDGSSGLGSRRASSARSIGGGSKPSTMVEEDGGYLPSRWANGDKNLRTTETDREKYRPMEWRNVDPSGKVEDWHPSTKDQFKRNMKDIATSARFSLFRTKKKLLRKAEI
ncbi:uncharacterized protein IL334_002744 [Kwoniella shivajii]|uniref:Uncharacterized protein n=1 Tax=Kwoniella shivajii TaxID=564305 RepID=A0ABZ1CXA0_9TREE|nr:hypothetical protein IL334_002744 [Kwoniella shivajii]